MTNRPKGATLAVLLKLKNERLTKSRVRGATRALGATQALGATIIAAPSVDICKPLWLRIVVSRC